MQRIKNRTLADLLTWAAQATDGPSWLPLHEFVRRVNLAVFPKILSEVFRRITSNPTLRILPRHSIQTPGKFNCFRSDIDFSAIFDEEPSKKEIHALLKGYERLSKLFPFIGEIEIYTRQDWDKFLEAQRCFLPIATLVRQLRKWNGQLAALEKAETSYHEFKARDAIVRIRTSLGLPAQPSENENLQKVLQDIIETRMQKVVSKDLLLRNRPSEPLTGYSGFLGWQIPQMNLCFLAALPDADWKFLSHASAIQSLRENPKIWELLKALCTIEWITLKHHKRVSEIEIDENWFQHMYEISHLDTLVAHPPQVIWFTGLPCSGKTTLALAVAKRLRAQGQIVEHLDGDVFRKHHVDLGFSQKDRNEHIRRIAQLAKIHEANGVFVVASFVSPFREARESARKVCKSFIEVHVSTPLSECERRDTKGLYARARKGEIPDFTGIGQPYEEPTAAEITIDTTSLPLEESVKRVLAHLKMS